MTAVSQGSHDLFLRILALSALASLLALTAMTGAQASVSADQPSEVSTPTTADTTGTRTSGVDSRQVSPQRPDTRTAGVPPALSRPAGVPPALISAPTPRNDGDDQGGRNARDTKQGRRDACGTETTAPTPAAPETGEGPAPQTATKQVADKPPPTLHSAINKVAEDYAKSIEVKSTRPGEDLPFTLTVGGSIQVRGEYWSGLPRHSGLSQTDHAGISSRTRVSLCADFGHVQCVMEASKTQGGTRLFGGRDVD